MDEPEPAVHIRPALRPRLEFLATAAMMSVIAAVCAAMALTRGSEILQPDSGIQLGGLEPFKHVLVGAVWAVAGCSLLLGLWSLWAVGAASRRLHVVIDDRVLEWRPYLGLRQRVDLGRLRMVEDRPGGRFEGPHLAVTWGRRRKPLKLYRKWYLPLDYKAIRRRLQQAGTQAERAATPHPVNGLAEAGSQHSARHD
jgi:hypothetical protein